MVQSTSLFLLGILACTTWTRQISVTAFAPAVLPKPFVTNTIPGIPSERIDVNGGPFAVVEDPSKRGATVLEAPVSQDGVRMFIGICSDSFGSIDRPGNGGIRLLNYESVQHAIDDAVRLAQGMTRKHDMFRTGFSGAKIVVMSEHRDLSVIERKHLMQDAAKALHALEGSMYTGCDLNTCDIDMDFLTEATGERYVLAGRNSRVDTNVATASSVIGSILGAVEAMEGSQSKICDFTFTVQGCGKVGSSVAKQLVQLGAKCVQTCDLFPDATKIQGCTPIGNCEDWATTPCDILVPCANSLAITEEIAAKFPNSIKYCIGATNSPFASAKAKAVFEYRSVMHIPESISSAGAILADSVEWYDLELYQNVEPTLMYSWIRDISCDKASSLVMHSSKDPQLVDNNLRNVVPSRIGDPVGKDFPDYVRQNLIKTDTLIVGGGLAGTATAFALTQRGQKSLLLEQGESLAPAISSSNGDSRMYRKMYSNAFFSKMQSKALDRWKDVERLSGEKLLQENGLLFYGEDTGETVEGSVLGAKQVMEELNLPHTFYATGDEIAEAYPSLKGCRGKPYSGVVEDTAGHIRASKACHAMARAAESCCRVMLNTQVMDLDTGRKDGKVVATTRDGKTILANRAVIAAGPWTNAVLKSSNLPPLRLDIWQVQWAHYEIDPDLADGIPQAFHFRKQSENDGGLYYVFPASASECMSNNGKHGKSYVKVGVDFPTGKPLNNMGEFCYEGGEDVLTLMDEWVREHLPQCGPRVDSYCHPYTMTPDSYFVLDNVKPNVAVFSGGSGRAFKFGPLIGDCLAALINDAEEAPVDLTSFSIQRDALRAEELLAI